MPKQRCICQHYYTSGPAGERHHRVTVIGCPVHLPP